MSTFEPEKVRQFFYLLLLTVLGIILFIYLKPFLPSFLGAFTLYGLMRKYMKRMLVRNWKPASAALLLMLVSFLVILLPVFMFVNLVRFKLGYVIHHISEITNSVILVLKNIETRIGYQFLDEEDVRKFIGLAVKQLPIILGATFNYLLVLLFMYFILYFMLTGCNKIEKRIEDVLPLRKDNLAHVEHQVNKLIISNAVGIPLIAFFQGIAGLIIYLILGIPEPFIWFAITCFVCLFPVIGSPLAYIPIFIMEMANGETTRGIIILVYGIAVIGTIDSVFRIWFQKFMGNLHPLITILGVFAGIPLFGFIGLVFGPLLISLFILLLRIYRIEFIAQGERLGED